MGKHNVQATVVTPHLHSGASNPIPLIPSPFRRWQISFRSANLRWAEVINFIHFPRLAIYRFHIGLESPHMEIS